MNRFITLFALLLFANVASGQNVNLGKGFSKDKAGQEEFKAAEFFFDDANYLSALPHYRTLEASYGDNEYLRYRIGICLLYKSDETQRALEYLESVKAKNAKAADIDYYLGRAYHLNEKFDQALVSLDLAVKNKKTTPANSELAQRYITYCNNAKTLVASPINVKITNAGMPVNSESSEYVPVVTSDESTMLFTYVGPESRGGLQRLPGEPDPLGMYFEDIWSTFKVNGRWEKPVAADTNINSFGHDACIAISNDGQTLIVFKNSEMDLGDIYFSKLDGVHWSIPVRIEGDVNTPMWEGSASLTANEKVMYFASEREGGYGGRDIYVARMLPDGRWGRVRNLGPKINSALNEDAPFIHPNGVTLLYSSESFNSMGGYDIFRTDLSLADSTWSDPENIGYPINTPGDDKYFVLSTDGKRGYYSSGKSGGMGQQDIYIAEADFDLKDANVLMVTGVITVDGKPVKGTILVRSDGKVLDGYTATSNSMSGKYLVNLRQGKVYEIEYDIAGFPKILKMLDASKTRLSLMTENIDLNLVTNDRGKMAREDSIRRADSLLAAQNLLKNTLKQTQTVTNADTTVKTSNGGQIALAGMNNDEYTSVMDKFGDVRVEGLTFTVQVAAYRNAANFDFSHLRALGTVEKQQLDDGVTRFTIGSFNTLREADGMRKKVNDKGNTDAFITAIYKGKRILLKDLAAANFFRQ